MFECFAREGRESPAPWPGGLAHMLVMRWRAVPCFARVGRVHTVGANPTHIKRVWRERDANGLEPKWLEPKWLEPKWLEPKLR